MAAPKVPQSNSVPLRQITTKSLFARDAMHLNDYATGDGS